jgi:hypothetical protein
MISLGSGNRRPLEIDKCYFRTASIILVISGLLKLMPLSVQDHGLDLGDPLFGVSRRFVLTVVAALEICMAFLLAGSKNAMLCRILVTWLGSCFAFYRVFSMANPGAIPCKCLGNLGAWLGVQNRLMDYSAWAIIVYLVGGGVLLSIYPRPVGHAPSSSLGPDGRSC